MTPHPFPPSLSEEGVTFMVCVDTVERQCVVTHAALHKLSELKSIDDNDADMLEIFHAFEATISGVARRLVGARVAGNPLVMQPATFSAPRTR